MSKSVAEVVVEVLEGAGVRHCYGIVGDTLNLIAERMNRSGIEWVHVRHEEAGGFAAAGEALVTGGLTACAGTCGPGSLHFLNAMFEANRNRAPVILIATQIVRSELGFDFIQEVDLRHIYRTCSVYCDMIYEPEQARRKLVVACQTAIAKRGVAVVIVPVDVSQAIVERDVPYRVHRTQPVTRPSDDELDRIAAMLNEGGRIVVYGGSGCEGALHEIVAVAERLQAPIAHTSRAKDFLEPGNPYNIGMTGILGNEAAYHAVLGCDTLLLLGADFAWRQFYPESGRIVQIDIDPGHLGRRTPIAIGAVGDVKATLGALLPRLRIRGDRTFQDESVLRYAQAMTTQATKTHAGRSGEISGSYLTKVLNEVAAPDAAFVGDDGTPAVWMLRFITANGRRRTFGSLLHGTMANGLSTAIGVCKGSSKDRQVIAMCGDGGLTMLFGDLLTLVQERISLKVIVYDNGKLGFVEIEQMADAMLPTHTDLRNPDFGRVAAAMGMWGKSIGHASELDEALEQWLAVDGPALLHVKVSSMELVVPPFTAMKPAIGMTLYAARAVLHGRGEDVWEMFRQNFS